MNTTRIWKVLGILALAAFVGSILWSMWVDTLQPLVREGDSQAVAFHLVGLPLILVGVGIFVYGGFVFVRDTVGSFGNEKLLQNVAVIRTKPSRKEVTAAQWQNVRFLWQAWKPGLAWLALGFLLIAAGGFLINL